jgi:lipoate-protein ligase A
MRYLDLTLPSPAENIALDEALLDEAERSGRPAEVLRLWEPPEPMVVLGRSSRIKREADLDLCRELGIPVLRRPSGGAAIVTGPGCLMYALVLSHQLRPGLRMIGHAHHYVLHKIARALAEEVPGVHCEGTSDLALHDRKFSGNSIRSKRHHMLYHGTLLYHFSLGLIDRCLAMPPRQPEYRQSREHDAFLANLPLSATAIREILITAWNAEEARSGWPRALTARLVAERYGRIEWNEGL